MVPLSQITNSLQVYMGSVYVNDFDFNNRSYRVYVQADSKFRSQPKDIGQYYLRSDTGKMISLDNLVTVEQTANPQVIPHYNLFRSAEINGTAAPGHSSGEGIAAMEALSRKVLPNGMTFEWSGLSLEEIESGGKALILFALGLVVVYLTLAAQYESYVQPASDTRSEEHTSELQSLAYLVCRLLLEKKKKKMYRITTTHTRK